MESSDPESSNTDTENNEDSTKEGKRATPIITRLGNQMAQSIESLKSNLSIATDVPKSPVIPSSNSSSIFDLTSFGRALKSPTLLDSAAYSIKSFSDYIHK